MTNEDKLYDLLRQTDPQLYLIKVALEETGVNPDILPRVIRSLANLAYGTGYGKIQIFMSERIVTQIKPEESDQLNFPTLNDRLNQS